MAIKLASVKRDLARESEGDWIPAPELMDPNDATIPEFRVRGLGYGPFNMAVSLMRAKLARPYNGDQTRIPNEIFHREHGRLLAQHILLDWRNVAEPYSRGLAEEILCDPASPVQIHVIRCAAEVAEVQQEYDSTAAKNSGRASGGSSKAEVARLAG